MRMIFFTIFFLPLISTSLCAQKLAPTVIASDGGFGKTSTMSLAWTLGETAVESVSSNGRFYTQGFHQPLLLAKSFHPSTEEIFAGYDIVVAPNPVQSMLNVYFETPQEENLQVFLTDILGRNIISKETSGKGVFKLDMSPYISGVYLLSIRNSAGHLVRTFKIIKAQ
jgi:hypothetical protein